MCWIISVHLMTALPALWHGQPPSQKIPACRWHWGIFSITTISIHWRFTVKRSALPACAFVRGRFLLLRNHWKKPWQRHLHALLSWIPAGGFSFCWTFCPSWTTLILQHYRRENSECCRCSMWLYGAKLQNVGMMKKFSITYMFSRTARFCWVNCKHFCIISIIELTLLMSR